MAVCPGQELGARLQVLQLYDLAGFPGEKLRLNGDLQTRLLDLQPQSAGDGYFHSDQWAAFVGVHPCFDLRDLVILGRAEIRRNVGNHHLGSSRGRQAQGPGRAHPGVDGLPVPQLPVQGQAGDGVHHGGGLRQMEDDLMIWVIFIGILQQDGAIFQPCDDTPHPDGSQIGGRFGGGGLFLRGEGRQGAHHSGAQSQRKDAGDHLLHGNSSSSDFYGPIIASADQDGKGNKKVPKAGKSPGKNPGLSLRKGARGNLLRSR